MSPPFPPPSHPHQIIAIPYPGRGHINPMLNLLTSLSLSFTPTLHVTVILTEEWLTLLNPSPTPSSPISFVTIPNVVPSEHVRGGDHAGFMEAVLEKMEAPVEKVIEELMMTREGEREVGVVILADSFAPWAVELGRRKGLRVASFWPASAAFFAVFSGMEKAVDHGHYPVDQLDADHRVDYLSGIPSIRLSDLPNLFRSDKQRYKKIISLVIDQAQKAQCLVFRSSYELEPLVIDALRSNLSLPIYSVGPAIPYSEPSTPTLTEPNHIDQWLSSHPKSSVLYISLGSYLSTTPTQTQELAAGLADSGVPFLWVARHDSLNLSDDCGDRGLVVPWCDQMRVLAHESTGGFLTHCGWNSALEAAFSGVPVLTFPISADQPVNCKVMVEDWGIGWRLEGGGGKGGLVGREEIARIVKRFMDLKDEGRMELDKRAKKIKEKARLSVSEGSTSETNIDLFVQEVLGS